MNNLGGFIYKKVRQTKVTQVVSKLYVKWDLTKLYVKGEQLLSKLYVSTILFENRDQTSLVEETKKEW